MGDFVCWLAVAVRRRTNFDHRSSNFDHRSFVRSFVCWFVCSSNFDHRSFVRSFVPSFVRYFRLCVALRCVVLRCVVLRHVALCCVAFAVLDAVRLSANEVWYPCHVLTCARQSVRRFSCPVCYRLLCCFQGSVRRSESSVMAYGGKVGGQKDRRNRYLSKR